MKMNVLLFVWLIIFVTYSNADSDSGEGGDNGENNIFNNNNDDPDFCPCIPLGPICDVLATCQRDAFEFDPSEPIECLGLVFEDAGVFQEINILFCGNDPVSQIDFLLTPVFATIGPFFPGVGICVASYDGIAGVVDAIFNFIEDNIDELEDCDNRRRLQHAHSTSPSDTTSDTTSNPFHGSVVAFEKFVQLLEYNGNDKQELMQLIMAEGGIAHLAGMMKQKTQSGSTTPSRRLLDSGDGDDSDVCDFGFLFGFLGGFLRRRLSVEGPFDPATHPFEALLSTLYSTADCENNREATPILCILQDTLNNRRRLESDDESGDGDGDNSRCCGDIGTNIQLITPDQVDACVDQLSVAFEALDQALSPDGCDSNNPDP